MRVFVIVLFCFLVICAVAVSFSRNLLNSILMRWMRVGEQSVFVKC